MKHSLLLITASVALLVACESRQTETATESESAPATAAVENTTPSTPEAGPTAAVAPAATPAVAKLDGAALYANNCQACHQASGLGLPNAFPSLKGSPRVNDADGAQLASIVLQGYNARDEYGVMPGYAASMNDEQVAAVATHVRNSWGNTAPAVSADLVRKLRAASK